MHTKFLRQFQAATVSVAVASVTVAALTGCGNLSANPEPVPPPPASIPSEGLGHDLGYYWQSVIGHVRIMSAAKPVADWLADPQSPEPLKARLALSQRMRDFAVHELGLPDNSSYRRYADLKRRAVVWNVVAAPPDSLTLKTWCFPVTGCVGYRGYFDEAAAQAYAQDIGQRHGLEVSVYGVPAYSTLGWLNWAGGDPLLNTFIHYPEGELARMLFHEIAHQVAFAADDTVFNESFASTVERLGAQRWLASQASEAARTEYESFDAQRRAFKALTLATRQRLNEVYDTASSGTITKPPISAIYASKLATKTEVMAQFKADYTTMKNQFNDAPERWKGYDAWVAKANNASFGTLAAYDDWVPALEALFKTKGENWGKFYAEVKRLAALPKDERGRVLGGMRVMGALEKK
jgi:predicted aminopeptidase